MCVSTEIRKNKHSCAKNTHSCIFVILKMYFVKLLNVLLDINDGLYRIRPVRILPSPSIQLLLSRRVNNS